MQVIGKVKLIGETKTFGTGNFAKRDLVVTTDEQYPQMILREFKEDLRKSKVVIDLWEKETNKQ
mgnify:CR=1 FL=1